MQMTTAVANETRALVLEWVMFFVYIIYSQSADRYYVGQTDDIIARLQRHNDGKVTSTKAYAPWEIKYSEVYATRSEAMRREKEIKARKSRRYIELLIQQHSRQSPAQRD